jgi:AraC family transcriptional regulator of adaptative response/methylated-DNA-[protein]-cysteine methyltransferase
MGKAIEQIRKGTPLDDVALGNGYDSHSGFREAFARTFGKPPGRSRQAGCIVVSWVESPVGPLVVGAVEEGICLLEFSDRRMLEAQFTTLRKRFGCAIVPGKHPHLNRIAIVIPCHRVVNKGGQLGGYGGGLWRKQFLLDLERGK